MRTVKLPDGTSIPALGMGTWGFGEAVRNRALEVRALQTGIDNGIRLIDTAEMYGEGGAEEVIAEALEGRRNQVFLTSKAYPHNASRVDISVACENSLTRLRTDRIDLYLLHWRGGVPLADTVAGLEQLVDSGKIRYWGVSNFDMADMADLSRAPNGQNCATNQVMFSLAERGIEWDLLPAARKAGMPIMAYSPLGQGSLPYDKNVMDIAKRHKCSAAAVAVAWTMAQPGVFTIPKAAKAEHMAEIAQAAAVQLRPDDMAFLNKAFPPPTSAQALAKA
jgi:diketogulonate reductase-like aldo/keto reductase